jgi:hypothetical protein
MIKNSSNKESIQSHLYSLIIPEEILAKFNVKEVIENEEELLIVLVEQQRLIPKALEGKEVALNGFMNRCTLAHYPVMGRKCYLDLHRRRWKEKGSTSNESYHNEYEFTAEGTTATKSFGDFLKSNSLINTPSALAPRVSLPE